MSSELPASSRRAPWLSLRQFTPARVALGRSGGSVPTTALLEFRLAQARARDALGHSVDEKKLMDELRQATGSTVLRLESRARNQQEYRLRPDLGRRLAPESAERLKSVAPGKFDLAVVVSEGLSALAIEKHAAPLLTELTALLRRDAWQSAPVSFVRRGRVALQDEIGELLDVPLALIVLGERPGLISPDSLGAYLVFNPRRGNTDAQRNCVSNISRHGLSPKEAAAKIHWLLTEARRRGHSGIELKDTFSAGLAE